MGLQQHHSGTSQIKNDVIDSLYAVAFGKIMAILATAHSNDLDLLELGACETTQTSLNFRDY